MDFLGIRDAFRENSRRFARAGAQDKAATQRFKDVRKKLSSSEFLELLANRSAAAFALRSLPRDIPMQRSEPLLAEQPPREVQHEYAFMSSDLPERRIPRPVWSYCNKRLDSLQLLGASSFDLRNVRQAISPIRPATESRSATRRRIPCSRCRQCSSRGRNPPPCTRCPRRTCR